MASTAFATSNWDSVAPPRSRSQRTAIRSRQGKSFKAWKVFEVFERQGPENYALTLSLARCSPSASGSLEVTSGRARVLTGAAQPPQFLLGSKTFLRDLAVDAGILGGPAVQSKQQERCRDNDCH